MHSISLIVYRPPITEVYLANLEYPFFGNLNFPTLLVCSIYIH